ncbi:MAG TPA: hypothetical protein VMW22_03510 [Candidatus Desulfaltia sp.]|nr:hypothetical protein [Candidatus Desulfaltia sp.]
MSISLKDIEKILSKKCDQPCTKIIKFMTDRSVPANTGISLPPYNKVDKYRYINVFVEFEQNSFDEPPVDLGLMFALDQNGIMGSRRYVNFEENISHPQSVNFISVSGEGTWHGSPHNKSSYLTRFPIMGPFVQVLVYNKAQMDRNVSVWAYLVS